MPDQLPPGLQCGYADRNIEKNKRGLSILQSVTFQAEQIIQKPVSGELYLVSSDCRIRRM